VILLPLLLGACAPSADDPPDPPVDTVDTVDVDTPDEDTVEDSSADPVDTGPATLDHPFADRVVSFTPGAGAGYGQANMPDVVLGPPHGAGPLAGSLHVVSLGDGGELTLELFTPIVDGEGPDLIVFENPFQGWTELGEVAVSEDGEDWVTFACDAATGAGCAGVWPVLSHPDNGVSPTDPSVSGGDLFDLASIGVLQARFVRVRDTGTNPYEGNTGGFDLDAVAAVARP
jgi:hypothetical protein